MDGPGCPGLPKAGNPPNGWETCRENTSRFCLLSFMARLGNYRISKAFTTRFAIGEEVDATLPLTDFHCCA